MPTRPPVYVPFSTRQAGQPRVLSEGVPDHLHSSLVAWISDPWTGPSSTWREVQAIERLTEKTIPRHFAPHGSSEPNSILTSAAFLRSLAGQPERMLDVVEALAVWRREDKAAVLALTRILDDGASAYRVVVTEDGPRLERRVDATVTEMFDDVAGKGQAGNRLRVAWQRVYERRPNIVGAYDAAVKAVELVSIPIVLPKDPIATLGRVNACIRNGPARFIFELGSSGDVAPALAMQELLWTRQCRHGDPDPGKPDDNTFAEAEAAVHLAAALVHYWERGIIRRR